MKKFKKILLAVPMFFAGIASKLYAKLGDNIGLFEAQPLYGVEMKPINIPAKILNTANSVIDIILFVIGVVTIFSKKKNKEEKLKTIGILLAIGVVIYLIVFAITKFILGA